MLDDVVGHVEELRTKLESLLAMTPQERADLGRHARRVAVERWSWAHVADRLLEPFT